MGVRDKWGTMLDKKYEKRVWTTKDMLCPTPSDICKIRTSNDVRSRHLSSAPRVQRRPPRVHMSWDVPNRPDAWLVVRSTRPRTSSSRPHELGRPRSSTRMTCRPLHASKDVLLASPRAGTSPIVHTHDLSSAPRVQGRPPRVHTSWDVPDRPHACLVVRSTRPRTSSSRPHELGRPRSSTRMTCPLHASKDVLLASRLEERSWWSPNGTRKCTGKPASLRKQ